MVNQDLNFFLPPYDKSYSMIFESYFLVERTNVYNYNSLQSKIMIIFTALKNLADTKIDP